MLAVQPQQFEPPREEISMDTVPEMNSESETMNPKQEVKKQFFTLPKIILILAVVSVLAIGGYQLMNLNETNEVKSQMLQSHDKIIQYADSSKKEGSNAGSASSKSSKTNDKPNPSSQPASKNVITSNSQLGGSGNGGKDNEDDQEDGDKRKKKLNDKKSMTNDASTDEDDSEQEEEDDEIVNDVQWIDNQPSVTGTTPLIGSARNP